LYIRGDGSLRRGSAGSHDHQDRDGDDEDRQKPAEQGSRAPLRRIGRSRVGRARREFSLEVLASCFRRDQELRALGHDVGRDTWLRHGQLGRRLASGLRHLFSASHLCRG
jgi:hypothetical protein